MTKAKLVGILITAAVLATVIIQNREPVQARFLWVTIEMPQVLLLLLTATAGLCLGLLVALARKPKSSAGE